MTDRTWSVVVVDDAPDLRLLVRMILDASDRFHVLGEAGDGREAIDVAQRHQPDVVLLDLSMPGMDGLQALSRLRDASPTSEVVVLSGFESDQLERAALEAGAAAYLNKANLVARLVPDLTDVLRTVSSDQPPAPPRTGRDFPRLVDQQALAALREGAALRPGEAFQLLADNLVDLTVVLLDAAGRISSWSRGAQRLHGYRAEEILGQHFSRLYPEEDVLAGRPTAALERAATHGWTEDEGWRICKDGERFWANVVMAPLRDQAGGVSGFVWIERRVARPERGHDAARAAPATPGRSAEHRAVAPPAAWGAAPRAGADAKDHFHKVFEEGPIGMALAASDFRFIEVNEEFARMLGYTPEELVDRSFVDVTHPEDVELDSELANQLFAGEIPNYRIEKRYLARDGRVIWVEMAASVLRDEQGRSRYGLAMVQDISQRKAASQALREAYERERETTERLRALDDFKNAMLSAVSHDLRNPVVTIIGFAELLGEQGDLLDAEDRSEFVSTLISNGKRILRLLDDLLDLERLRRGTLHLDRRPQDLGALVREVVDELRVGNAVQLDLRPVPVSLDARVVKRMIENLVTNALKHAPTGTSVEVRLWSESEEAVLAVEDRGPGVPDDLKQRIFEPFERGSFTPAPGIGIGLSLVSQFAWLHEGRAWVEDRGGGGASFRVAFPLGDHLTPDDGSGVAEASDRGAAGP